MIVNTHTTFTCLLCPYKKLSMAKSIIRFSFPGNIVWGSTIKDDWGKILIEYIIRELSIGDGIFLGIELCLNESKDYTITDHYPKNHVITEIICDIPKSIADDEFDIRARIITLLEDKEFDLIKFHNCGPAGDISIVTEKS